ncbi:unnamed protein product [Hapterophycus canaliculatus]
MPGRKKGRQKGAAGSKSQSARKWNDALREAREDLTWDPKQKLRRGGDTAPPRLSTSGFRSLATLLRQRVRADEIDAAAPPRVPSEISERPAAGSKNYFSIDWTESRSRRTRSLMSLCVSQIGRDFLSYRADDDAIAEAFLLLPAPCLSRVSRSASARGTVADHNIGLLCSPGVSTLWLRGRFTDEGAAALMPGLSATDKRGRVSHDLSEVYREGEAGSSVAESPARIESSSGNDRGDLATPQAASEAGAGGQREAVKGQEEDWETACDRIEASLRGCVSLTSLEMSSPRVTADFIKRLVIRIPSLRRLGLRGSLGVVGGPDAVCDHVPRLAALRELNVSHCTWFCDITLRRLAKTLSLGSRHPEEYEPQKELVEQQEEGSSGWGAAAAAARSDAVLRDTGARSGTPGAGLSISGEHRTGSGEHRTGSGGRATSLATYPRRFRTFTVVCARTAVTDKGARAAEAVSPGLLVVLEEELPNA